ncbi:alpha/beta hydrolase [Terricaulis sp.]|uniref:alpha/beta hydrolase n=1 Tax=Terricaulis sp. TaxID=2768686 RepID=UPI002AC75EFA|nr:alpha/beta hydrolase [Terricaulis sp.]MDZ4690190.1 alpha/beta hydrolase [Terricaulis sp.]
MAETWDFGRGLSGYRWPAGDARANVLLAHGFAEYAERYVAHYHQLVPKLNALGFNVYAFDLRGHGRSPGARGVTDMRAAVADHIGARRVLAAEGKPLFLFGHSLGGLLTAASAARDKSNVAGVILSAPALSISAPAHLRAIAGLVSIFAPGARLVPPLDPEGLSRIPEEVAAYRNDPMISDTRVPAKTGATAIDIAEASWPLYRKWTLPILVLHGEQDRATDPEGSKRFAALAPAPDKHLILYPQGRHELLNDLERDAALAAITDWLSERAPAQ